MHLAYLLCQLGHIWLTILLEGLVYHGPLDNAQTYGSLS